MKQAKVLDYTKTRKPVAWRQRVWALFRIGLRILIACLPLVPFAALAVVFLLPETPHLRMTYIYNGSSTHPIYRECEYLGIHGKVRLFGPACPIVTFLGQHSERRG